MSIGHIINHLFQLLLREGSTTTVDLGKGWTQVRNEDLRIVRQETHTTIRNEQTGEFVTIAPGEFKKKEKEIRALIPDEYFMYID